MAMHSYSNNYIGGGYPNGTIGGKGSNPFDLSEADDTLSDLQSNNSKINGKTENQSKDAVAKDTYPIYNISRIDITKCSSIPEGKSSILTQQQHSACMTDEMELAFKNRQRGSTMSNNNFFYMSNDGGKSDSSRPYRSIVSTLMDSPKSALPCVSAMTVPAKYNSCEKNIGKRQIISNGSASQYSPTSIHKENTICDMPMKSKLPNTRYPSIRLPPNEQYSQTTQTSGGGNIIPNVDIHDSTMSSRSDIRYQDKTSKQQTPLNEDFINMSKDNQTAHQAEKLFIRLKYWREVFACFIGMQFVYVMCNFAFNNQAGGVASLFCVICSLFAQIDRRPPSYILNAVICFALSITVITAICVDIKGFEPYHNNHLLGKVCVGQAILLLLVVPIDIILTRHTFKLHNLLRLPGTLLPTAQIDKYAD